MVEGEVVFVSTRIIKWWGLSVIVCTCMGLFLVCGVSVLWPDRSWECSLVLSVGAMTLVAPWVTFLVLLLWGDSDE